MTMTYDQAVQAWGRQELRAWYPFEVKDADPVSVEFNFTEGYACCGGRDPDCYCSFAESPRAEVVITSHGKYSKSRTIDIDDFDFLTVVREIVVAGGGTVTAE